MVLSAICIDSRLLSTATGKLNHTELSFVLCVTEEPGVNRLLL